MSDAIDGGATDVTPPDIAEAPEDVPVPPRDVSRDIQHIDFNPGDLLPDRTPPFVVSTWPEDGQEEVPLDFVIRVEFSELIRATTIVLNATFSVTDVDGEPVSGTIGYEPSREELQVVTFTPTQPIAAASPYRVELAPSIRDLSGSSMEEFVRFRFYTLPHLVPDQHRILAETYAPVVAQETSGQSPEFDYLTAWDLDEDWDLGNNVDAIQGAQAVRAGVGYAVVETKSHYFITYLYYHPYQAAEAADDRFGNDLAGAQVVVARYPEQRPILVQTYFKTRSQEDILAYATTESGLSGAYLDGSWPEAELFPDGRFRSYLSTRTHQSCLWNDQDNTMPRPCVFPAEQIAIRSFIEYVFKDGQAEVLIKDEEAGFPHSSGDNPVGYALDGLLERIWPRRMDVSPGGTLFDDTFKYPSNQTIDQEWRPGRNLMLGSRFVNPVQGATEFGRPPWAWQWRPSIGGFVDLARGTFLLDPAYFVKKRFSGLGDWDPDTKTGFSLDYCFNPFLDIDLLPSDPECGTVVSGD